MAITVKEVDGVPTLLSINRISFDQTNGFKVVSGGASQADIAGPPGTPNETELSIAYFLSSP